ncbi:DDE-type integrase/transposase/recombinase [Chloroflexota bacterium]
MSVKIVTENKISCPHCNAEGVMKYGTYKGVQRYMCKSCERKFKVDDTLFHMKLDANLVSSALNMYYEGMSIKEVRRHLLQEHDHAPSTATIYEWVMKFTQYATDSIKDTKPKVGDTWIADETVLKIDGHNTWFWDIIDTKTRYLLATRISQSRTTRDAQILIDRAIKTAGKSPKQVVTDKLASYLDVNYGKGAEHIQGSPFKVLSSGESTSQIERFHGTLKSRTKVMRGLKNLETALEFTKGWLVHYNYLRPHESLDDKTPAEVAGVDYPYKNWADIIRKHKPDHEIKIIHTERGRTKLPPIQIGRPRKFGIRLTTERDFPIARRKKIFPLGGSRGRLP